MPLQFVGSKQTSIRNAGYDEKWLQDLIYKEPSILGLGDLKALASEVRQSSGGRLDLLLADLESDIVYEVEVMLGATDESHIIRTIEYWDIESRRRPDKEHRAVIVAEEITKRFFNVIWLLSRSIPIIAIKLDALQVDGRLTISFTKVLDLYEVPEVGDSRNNAATAQSWIEYSDKESHEVFEKVVKLISSSGKSPRITYNVDHIAVGGLRKNFAWFRPTRKNRHCIVELRVGEANLDIILRQFNEAGLDASQNGSNIIKIRLTTVELSRNTEMIKSAIEYAVLEGGGL
jgi:hypothetical protein